MTETDIKEFAVEHAPKLAENITRLCGQVIARGIQGHLEHACELQQQAMALEKQRDALLKSVEDLLAYAEDVLSNREQLACFKPGVVQAHVKAAHAAIELATGSTA